jgi:Zn-dependent M16 (insulinase) family peptidase
MSAGRRRAERERLAAIRAALTETDQVRIGLEAHILAERQQRQDDPELLPKRRAGRRATGFENRRRRRPAGRSTRYPRTWYAQGTNGMVYLQAVLDLPALEPEELDLLPLFCACLTEVGSAGRDYRTTQALQAAVDRRHQRPRQRARRGGRRDRVQGRAGAGRQGVGPQSGRGCPNCCGKP